MAAYSNVVLNCKTKRGQQSMNSFHTVNRTTFCITAVCWVKFSWQSTSRQACHFLLTLLGSSCHFMYRHV